MAPDTFAVEHLRSLIKIVEEGGGVFRAVMPVPALGDKPAYYAVLFDSPATHSTLCMHSEGLTAEKVREHIREYDEKFGIIS